MSIISPRAGMSIAKAGIKKTLKQEIEDFDILYFQNPQKIDIRVYNFVDAIGHTHQAKVFKYDESAKLFTIINAMLKKYLQPDREIVKALISYSQMKVFLTARKMVTPGYVSGDVVIDLPEYKTETKVIDL